MRAQTPTEPEWTAHNWIVKDQGRFRIWIPTGLKITSIHDIPAIMEMEDYTKHRTRYKKCFMRRHEGQEYLVALSTKSLRSYYGPPEDYYPFRPK